MKPYVVENLVAPLDMLSEGPAGEVWYRIPTWRVTFKAAALAGLDLRVHRGLGHEGIWTLTEATTGCKVYDGWGDEPEDTADDMLDEFVAVYLPKLTKDMVEKAIVKAREMLSGRAPSPFARPEAATNEWSLVAAVLAYDRAIRACANDPEKMSSFCSADGEDLDTLYLNMLERAAEVAEASCARSPLAKHEEKS